jgi:hypothetical protein
MKTTGNITVYRDQPKRGETDAGWCAYRSFNGHVMQSVAGKMTPAEAYAAVGGQGEYRA